MRLQGETNALLQARVQRYRIPDQRSVAQVISAVQGDPRVQLVQPNYLYRHQQKTKKKQAKKGSAAQAELQYAPDKLRLGSAHRVATGKTTLVAVIDSGIDRRHPEVKGAVVRWFNAAGARQFKADAHGTAVAGIIGARGQLTGVAPAARLLGIRAFFAEKGSGALATTYVLLRAVDWAHRYKARVFNLSFAGPDDEAVRRILKAAYDKGAILIAAAGNDGAKAPPVFPAAYPFVIAISATDERDRIYRSANRGDYVDVAAPGVDVLVPVLDGGYDFKSGTSFAAAHVSGIVALMLERQPLLTSAEVRRILASSAIDLGPSGQDAVFGAGRTDALSAVEAVVGQGSDKAIRAKAEPRSHTDKP